MSLLNPSYSCEPPDYRMHHCRRQGRRRGNSPPQEQKELSLDLWSQNLNYADEESVSRNATERQGCNYLEQVEQDQHPLFKMSHIDDLYL